MPNFKKYHIIDTHSPESSLFYEIFSNKSQKKTWKYSYNSIWKQTRFLKINQKIHKLWKNSHEHKQIETKVMQNFDLFT